MSLFVDTSALFAVLVKNDYMHVRARATFERLMSQPLSLHTTVAYRQSSTGPCWPKLPLAMARS